MLVSCPAVDDVSIPLMASAIRTMSAFNFDRDVMPRHSVRIVVVFLGLFTCVPKARADDLLEKALGAVFRITNGRSSGTCFLVSRGERAGKGSVVLVTAAHVLEETSESTCQLMLCTESADQSYSRTETSISVRDGTTPRWKRHPDLDIAALPVQLPEGVAVTPLSYEQLADAAWVAGRTFAWDRPCRFPVTPHNSKRTMPVGRSCGTGPWRHIHCIPWNTASRS